MQFLFVRPMPLTTSGANCAADKGQPDSGSSSPAVKKSKGEGKDKLKKAAGGGRSRLIACFPVPRSVLSGSHLLARGAASFAPGALTDGRQEEEP